jgi:hypothetical protein
MFTQATSHGILLHGERDKENKHQIRDSGGIDVRKIAILFVLILLLSGCAGNTIQSPTPTTAQPIPSSDITMQSVPPVEASTQISSSVEMELSLSVEVPEQPIQPNSMPTPSAGLPSQGLSSRWHYDLKKDGLYRTDRNTGDVIKINDQNYASGIIITKDWVYYSDNGLYRMDNDNKREQLTDDDWWNPSLSGDWLYCINSSGIARMKLDGSEKEQILECDCNEMVVTERDIFYALDVPEIEELYSEPGADDGPRYIGELHRVGLDGEGDVKAADMITDLEAYENNVYFADGEDDRLYAMNPETLEKVTIYDGNFIEELYLDGGYAFFILDRNLVKMSLADGTLTKLTNAYWNRCLGVLDGYVYGATDDPDADFRFYKIQIDGVELEKVE